MFDFNGGLIDGSSGWHVTFTDDEGEMKMIGDHYPWQLSVKLNKNSIQVQHPKEGILTISHWNCRKFRNEVRRMLINPKEEIGRMNQSSLTAPYDEVCNSPYPVRLSDPSK